jgi:dolichol kinase
LWQVKSKLFLDHFPPQRDVAAFLAISCLFCGESFAALAGPPFAPPSFPKATAAGFFGGLGVRTGIAWPAFWATILAASWFSSFGMLERLCMD